MAEVEAALVLLNELPSKERRACLELLIRIFGNVVKSPDEPKYRTLKVTNKTFKESVWQHESGRAVMEAAGWEIVGETIQLPSYVQLNFQLEVLLANRNVKPDKKDWIEETKVVVPNAANVREEQLREKALAEKAKQMAALKKEMAERKAIAESIRAEHRRDQETKKITKPSVAVPRGEGEVAKMRDRLPKGGG